MQTFAPFSSTLQDKALPILAVSLSALAILIVIAALIGVFVHQRMKEANTYNFEVQWNSKANSGQVLYYLISFSIGNPRTISAAK